MKSFAVIGIGRFGSNLAVTLHSLGYEVLALDEDEDRISHIAECVTHAVTGDPKDEAVLRAVGIRNFDCAIVALSEDTQTSILVTLMLKEMGVPFIVARAISELHKRVLQKVGADKVVCPEKEMGTKLAQSLAMTNILDYIDISNDYSIVEIKTPQKWIGKSIKQLNLRQEYGISVLLVKRQDTEVVDVTPNFDYILNTDDVMIVAGTHKNFSKLTL